MNKEHYRDIDNQIIINRIKYWNDKSDYFKNFFDSDKTYPLILLIDIISLDKNIPNIIIENYIDGLAFLYCYLSTKEESFGEKFDKLSGPALKILKDYVQSDYKSFLVKNRIDGDERCKPGIMDIPITPQRILRYIEDHGLNPLLPMDIERIKDKLIEELERKYDKTKLKKNKITGFQSSLTDKQIENLYGQMQGNYFDTSLGNFRAIFKIKLNNFTPIKRTKKFTNTLLIYFTSELFQKENPLDYVSITEYCFNAKGLSQAQNNYIQYNVNKKPRGYREIDLILKSI